MSIIFANGPGKYHDGTCMSKIVHKPWKMCDPTHIGPPSRTIPKHSPKKRPVPSSGRYKG